MSTYLTADPTADPTAAGPTAGPLIGVVGGYGQVGRQVAGMLHGAGFWVRVGGRDPARTARVAGHLGPGAAAATVDVTDPGQVASFGRGCQALVNCAGPSHLVADAVARAAAVAGSAYVDAGGDAALCRQLAGADVPMVIAAGLSPGLSGLLPRWLARQLPRPAERLRAWCGGRSGFTPAAAADMVASLDDGHGDSRAAWRAGAAAPRALTPLTDVTLPPFPGRVSAFPYLSGETRRLAVRLGLTDLDWFHVFAGEQTLATLNRLRAGTTDLAHAAAQLARAAEVDLAGRRPYQLMVIELTGGDRTRTLTMRADDGYRLTATVTAYVAGAALTGAVPAGAHLAADVLDPDPVVARLRADETVGVWQVTSEPADAVVEEGAL